MDDYVNDGEEGGEFGKDDCEEEEECDDPATPTLSTKAKQSPSAKGKVQLGVRQQTQPGLGMLYRLTPNFMSKFLGHVKRSCKRFTLGAISFPL